AERLNASLKAHHFDPGDPGYFLPADDAEALILRPKSTTDEATPLANSLMAANLVRLWRLTGNDTYRDNADALIEASSGSVATNLFAATGILNGLDLRLRATGVFRVAPPGGDASDLLMATWSNATPNTILSLHTEPVSLPPAHPASGKRSVNGRAAAYICRGEVCSLPLTSAADLATALTAQACARGRS